jgi:hypothetical protein
VVRWTTSVALALALAAAPAWAKQAAPATCAGLAECRAQAEAAIAESDYERAHDLAWRAAGQGPRNDRSLMFLLARAQVLSGRPDDALVMVRRLAELGAAVDVSADEFTRMRELPGWPAVEAVIAGKPGPAVVPSPSAPAVVPPAEAVAPKASTSKAPAPVPAPRASSASAAPGVAAAPIVVDDAGRFTSREFAPGGLACDAVSKRFVFGDRPGRKLLIVAEGSDHSIDLTRSEVAGFLDVMSLDIDTTNGNLWVASAEADGSGATLHRLQLISGRALASYGMPDGAVAVQPVDVAVTASRGVLVLDAAQRRVLVLRPGAAALTVLAELKNAEPASFAVGGQGGVAYVAHRDGLLSVDLRSGKVAPVTGPKGTVLGGIERLRRSGAALIGVQTLSDGTRRLVRLTLNAAGGAVTRLRVIDVPLPAGDAPIFTAVCGGTLGFLVGETTGESERTDTAWTIRRIRLDR